jgi:hypothetical protein
MEVIWVFPKDPVSEPCWGPSLQIEDVVEADIFYNITKYVSVNNIREYG